MKRLLLFILTVFVIFQAHGQVNRYFVYFTEKDNTPYSVNVPLEFLTQKSIERRQKEGIQITAEDLPVDPVYIQGLRQNGAETFYSSRWLNGVLIQIDESILDQIANLPYVESIDFAAEGNPLVSSRIEKLENKLDLEELVSAQNNDMLGVVDMKSDGFFGEGIMVANIDAGFPGLPDMPAFDILFSNNLIKHTFNFVENNQSVFSLHSHGTNTMSLIAGDIPDVYQSPAPNANYLLYISEDVYSEYRVEEYNWLFAAEKADSLGADIITSSLGYTEFDDESMNYTHADLDGNTAIVTKAANFATDRGIIVVTSAGNYGNKTWEKVSMPADCFECIAVGSVTSDEILSNFSSLGPTIDGRLKPTVVAMGTGVNVVNPDNSILAKNGTSLAAPQVAGLIAILKQAYPDLLNSQLIEVLKLSASNFFSPDNSFGYGIPNYTAVKNYMELNVLNSQILKFYPNPVMEGKLTISSENPEYHRINHLKIYNLMGQLVYDQNFELTWLNPSAEINLEGFNQGLYIIVLQAGEKVIKTRLVIR